MELGLFLEEKEIDLALITETRLATHRAIAVRGYQIFRKDRDGRGGGVAILVKHGLQAVKVDLGSQLESVGVELEIKGNLHRFVSVYIPPNRVISEAEVENLFKQPRTLVGGDLNAKNTS